MKRIRLISIASSAMVLAAGACSTADTPLAAPKTAPSPSAAVEPGVHRQYGRPQKLGNGMVRTYVVLDEKDGRTPLEVGVALGEEALQGLPAPMPMPPGGGHSMSEQNIKLLDMPSQNPTPYKFVELDWNPAGHEPETVYTFPHFDFHFYVVPREVRASIVPSDPAFATRAANLPGTDYRAPFYVDGATLAGGIPAAAATVPLMGLHWLDVRSPELQKLAGHPELYQDFTKTFIYGSWNGQFIFDEPMITRAYILAKKTATDPAVRDEIVPVSTANRYAPAGFYPSAYRITWDAQAKEYRIALTQLGWKS